MRTKLVLILLGLLVASPCVSTADGLLCKLPTDGAWVRFEGTLSADASDREHGPDAKVTFSLSMSSVGEATVEGERCRWIEMSEQFTVNGSKQPSHVAKALIPERYLKVGQNPVDHIVRAWMKIGDNDAVEVEDPGHQLPMIGIALVGPLGHVKQLDKEIVKSKLGELQCEGMVGTILLEQEDVKIRATYEMRLHDSAPFGVVSGKITLIQSGVAAGQATESGTMSFKLADFGTDAKSELPKGE